MRVLDIKAFACTLEKAIENSDYTIKDVSDYLDVSVQAVYSWLDGSKLPKLERLVPLAYLLDIKIDELLPTIDVKWYGAVPNGAEVEKKRSRK